MQLYIDLVCSLKNTRHPLKASDTTANINVGYHTDKTWEEDKGHNDKSIPVLVKMLNKQSKNHKQMPNK